MLLQGNHEPSVVNVKAGELGVINSMECDTFTFSTQTQLGEQQEGHPACK